MFNFELFILEESKPERQKLSLSDNIYMWHLMLGHINLDSIWRLVKDDPFRELNVGTLWVCESCLEDKMTKIFFLIKGHGHIITWIDTLDIWGPMSLQALIDYEYFVTFIKKLLEI